MVKEGEDLEEEVMKIEWALKTVEQDLQFAIIAIQNCEYRFATIRKSVKNIKTLAEKDTN